MTRWSGLPAFEHEWYLQHQGGIWDLLLALLRGILLVERSNRVLVSAPASLACIAAAATASAPAACHAVP